MGSDGNAAQSVGMGPQRLHQQAVVGAVRTDLNDHPVGHSGGIEHGQIVPRRRRRRSIAALGHKTFTHHVRVGVDRARRHLTGHERSYVPVSTPRASTCPAIWFSSALAVVMWSGIGASRANTWNR